VAAAHPGKTGRVPIPTLAPPTPDAPPTSRWRRGGVVLVALAIVAFWAYVFSIGENDDHESKVQDVTFAPAAEARCAQAATAIDALPPAYTAKSPQDRAVVLAQANAIVDAMVADLHTMVPGNARDASLVNGWLGDYDRYVEARHVQQAKLADGQDPAFAVPAEGGKPLTETMDAFATLNAMPSCVTPQDV
jgi:hypothetical protein